MSLEIYENSPKFDRGVIMMIVLALTVLGYFYPVHVITGLFVFGFVFICLMGFILLAILVLFPIYAYLFHKKVKENEMRDDE